MAESHTILSSQELAAKKAARKESVLEYQRKWRKDNAERYYALQRKRRSENPDKVKAQSLRYRLKNGEKMRADAKAYAKLYPEKVKARFAKYFEKTKHFRYEEWGWKEAIKRGCMVGDRKVLVELYRRAIELTKTSGEKWSVDHIIPLSYGGHHSPENCQVMPLRINALKSSNPFWVCSDRQFKDWRDVPMSSWPKGFRDIYDAIICHKYGNKLEDEIIA